MNAPTTVNWKLLTQGEKTEIVKQGIRAGLSASKIAEPLGISRNAVIGVANRAGLSFGLKSGRRAVKARVRAVAAGPRGSVSVLADGPVPKSPTTPKATARPSERSEPKQRPWAALDKDGRIDALRRAASLGKTMDEAAEWLSTKRTTLKQYAAKYLPGEFGRAKRVRDAQAAAERDQQRRETSPPSRIQQSLDAEARAPRRPPMEPAVPGGVQLMDIGLLQCRAPVWTEEQAAAGDYRFCGGRVKDGSSYCPEHHARLSPKGGEPSERKGSMAGFDVRVRHARVA
ncbi:GcrA family cell cycle regulator [Acuticoccus sediminis]|uniref:GcrA family cell cycle regulator n=1 Tax=Acuticoccus sediminis TaxID=2184697 RepID=UPI001CFE63D8|nr:GcrA family cell cycle regulator [Acuticoccus sediminis]